MIDLKTRTIYGLFWSFSEHMGLQAVQFVITIILARLLLPAEFGLIAMLTIFMGLARSLIESGFGSALIQKKDAGQVDYCSIFYFNILAGFLIAALLYFSAPFIAAFFNQTLLIPLTRFLTLNIILNAIGLIQSTILTRNLDFKAQMKVSLLALVLSGSAGVFLAYRGFGVWSLAVQSVLNSLFCTIFLWFFNSWRPSLVFSLAALKMMFPFGSKLLFSGLLDTFFQNIYNVFIGRVFSIADLGIYDKAKSMQTIATTTMGSTLSRVMFPSLTSIQDDLKLLKQAYRKTIGFAVFFHFPLMLILAAMAPALIIVLLTDKWSPSIPIFQLLCLAGLLYPLQVLNLNMMMVKGRSDLFFRLSIIRKVLIIVNIAITYRWGITGLIYGQIAVSIIGYYLNSYYSGLLIQYLIREQIRDIFPSLVLSIITGFCVIVAGEFINLHDIYQLIVQGLVGVSVYFGLNYLLKISALFELLRLAKSFYPIRTIT